MTLEEIKKEFPPYDKPISPYRSNFIDLTGQQFGELKVLYRGKNTNSGGAGWVCLCSCGKPTWVAGDHLRRGRTRSCGHLLENNLVGKKFGRLTVLEKTDKTYFRNYIYKCQCECGNIIEVRGGSLTTGSTKSCGCITSFGEMYTQKALTCLNLLYKRQYVFDELTKQTNKWYRYDFAIFHNDILLFVIEYDGIQHTDNKIHWNETLEELQARDEIKTNFCKEKNIPLLRIDYHYNNEQKIKDKIISFMEENHLCVG